MRVMEYLKKALRDAAVFYPEVQMAPVCILWPGKDRQLIFSFTRMLGMPC